MESLFNTIMLVDDNDTDNFISKRIIELTGFANEVIVHTSGKSALEFLENNSTNLDKLPELIFLDVNMPVVNGFVFVYEFDKFSPEVRDKCKIIVLSSSDNKRDMDQMSENDYVIKYVTKPLNDTTLDEIRSLN